jgi:hypothetical protein
MVDIRIRAPEIRAEVTVNGETNFAEALARLFDDETVTDPSATFGSNTPLGRRLQNMLDNSGDAYSGGVTHFAGIFAGWKNSSGWGDTGFKECFQDHALWPGSSMQVGHFMTAVDMGYRPIKTYLYIKHYVDMLPGDPWDKAAENISESQRDPSQPMTPGWWSPDEFECVNLMIAHEKVADSGVYGAEPSLWCKIKTSLVTVNRQEHNAFRCAFDGLGAGPRFDINKAQGTLSSITIGSGSGDSKQDLLLSLFGFKFGSMIRKSELTSTSDGGNWVRLNLKDPASKP